MSTTQGHKRSRTSSKRSATVRVRLIRKIAEQVDGVDVSGHAVGETFELSGQEAALLIAEGWAVRVSMNGELGGYVTGLSAGRPALGDEGEDRHELTLVRTLRRLRELRAEIEQRRATSENEHRRAEDVIREELRDSRAKTIHVASDRR